MSREAGRVRALLNAARLQHLLEAHDRVELLGYAMAEAEPSVADVPPAESPVARVSPAHERNGLRLDA
jgi:hypothetical protein